MEGCVVIPEGHLRIIAYLLTILIQMASRRLAGDYQFSRAKGIRVLFKMVGALKCLSHSDLLSFSPFWKRVFRER